MEAHLVAVDWGTSSFRAYLLDGHGAIEETVAADLGILRVRDGDFGRALESQVGSWLRRRPDAEVLLAGMIGSRQGWAEAPYVRCPVELGDLARELTLVTGPSGRTAWIVPGVRFTGRDGVPDVMRGEETQLMGALAGAPAGRGVFVLPGTHSKWAEVEDGRILSFATHLTGELFAVLSEHSILGALMEQGDDPSAFAAGCERASTPGGLTHHLFGVRTLGLFEALSPAGVRSYLSGLLIGHEVAAAGDVARSATRVGVVGETRLAERYRDALATAGVQAELVGANVAALGLHRIAAARAGERAHA